MSNMMKALVWEGGVTPVHKKVEIPVPGKNQVLLKVLRAGICGSDLSILGGKHPRAEAPLIMGHELAARVETLGAGVDEDEAAGLKPGSLVTIEPIISCGECVACKSGFPHVCSTLKLYGIDVPGGMAEYVAVAADRILPAREGMDPDLVVMAEPLAVAVHAVRTSGIRYGDSVCVIGGGPIGLLIALVARQTTPADIIVSEPQESRRLIAEKLGLKVINPLDTPVEDVVARSTSGRGVDICFESAGSQAAINSSTKVLRPRGTLVQVSMPKDQRTFNIVDLTFKELVVRGVRVYEALDFEKSLNFLCDSPELFRPFMSRLYGMEEVNDAFAAAKAGDQGLRVIFRVDD